MLFRRKKSSDDDSELNFYEIWQEKQAAIETAEIAEIEREKTSKGYLRWLNPVTYLSSFWSALIDDKQREAIKVIISMFGIIATASAAFGFIWTVWDSNENRKQNKEQFRIEKELTQQRLITDRFAKSATLLSDEDKAVRIAAIFSLERLARDSPKDHWTIMELLSAYVLEKSPLDEKDKVSKNAKDKASKPNLVSKQSPSTEVTKESPKSPKPIANDVQAALTVISRRDSEQDQGKLLDLSSANLREADLSRANLREADLREADLREADLFNTNLFSANLREANLSSADLRRASLSRADLRRASLSNTNLFSANLRRADLRSANLREADLREADLSSADLRRAKLSRAKLSSANLREADLFSANLSNAFLLAANFRSANLRSADLRNADLREADFSGANLRSANLRSADLRNADLFNANLRSADLRSAILLNTDLRETKNLTQSQLESREHPLICNSSLPQNIKIDRNRDCDKIANILHKRYPMEFSSLDKAEQYVQKQRQKKWN